MSEIKSRLFNFWGLLLGAGIRIDRVSSDYREINVSMRPHFSNRNYVSTHYGSSLYSMTHPFYAVILIESLGPITSCGEDRLVPDDGQPEVILADPDRAITSGLPTSRELIGLVNTSPFNED